MVAETVLTPNDLIAPLFVREGITEPQPISSLPGVVQHSRTSLVHEAREVAALGIPGIILFGVPEHRDPEGSGASDPDGIVQVALRDLRDALGDELVLIADLCLDEYTDHGHCGLLTPSGEVDNEAYAAKFASALYGPFREAVDVEIAGGGDRLAYQQDPANVREALEEVRLDVAEGADLVMVKPALAYLDVIARVRAEHDLPLAAYHVSGEYAMVKAAAERGWIDGDRVALEHVTAIKRAGADLVLTAEGRLDGQTLPPGSEPPRWRPRVWRGVGFAGVTQVAALRCSPGRGPRSGDRG